MHMCVSQAKIRVLKVHSVKRNTQSVRTATITATRGTTAVRAATVSSRRGVRHGFHGASAAGRGIARASAFTKDTAVAAQTGERERERGQTDRQTDRQTEEIQKQ